MTDERRTERADCVNGKIKKDKVRQETKKCEDKRMKGIGVSG